ncbi:hypothetical protein [Candidatus Phytoplasma sp. AldY-WA1]|uniref:hypothetical protein n=1 Tax=Candidatus Phytoplasma sp. AldY-WA1 TaxID=2852100 RepID=UPI00254AD603|nr:hypothetical protein [Candidatus Phytoplasma sp. AldY-WA1]
MLIRHLSIKIIFIFVIIILLIHPFYFIYAKLQNSFHQQTTHSVKLYSTQQLKDKWVLSQPKLIRYDLYATADKDIPKIIEYFKIDGITMHNFYDSPRYNLGNSQYLNWYLKDPPKNLLGVYFKPRKNPFYPEYHYGDYKYTLDDLLKNEISISEAYIFWDVKQEPRFQNTTISSKDVTNPKWIKKNFKKSI